MRHAKGPLLAHKSRCRPCPRGRDVHPRSCSRAAARHGYACSWHARWLPSLRSILCCCLASVWRLGESTSETPPRPTSMTCSGHPPNNDTLQPEPKVPIISKRRLLVNGQALSQGGSKGGAAVTVLGHLGPRYPSTLLQLRYTPPAVHPQDACGCVARKRRALHGLPALKSPCPTSCMR